MSDTDPKKRVRNRRQAYQLTYLGADGFLTPEARIIFADLKRFCNANKSSIRVSPQTGMIDAIAMGVAEGRREVWNRMMEYLHLDEKQLVNLLEG